MEQQQRQPVFETKTLKHLQNIANVFALSIPNLHRYTGLSVWYILYVTCVLALMVASFALGLKKWMDLFEMKVLGTTVVLSCMCLSLITASNVFASLSAVFWKRKDIVRLIRQFEEIDKCARDNMWELEANTDFTKLFIGIHLGLLVQLVTEACLFTKAFGPGALKLWCYTNLHIYIYMVNLLQICVYPLQIKHRCASFNGILKQLLASAQRATQVPEVHKTLEDTRLLLKVYDKLCDLFNSVSGCYGIQLVFAVSVSVMFMVEGFNTCLKFSLRKIYLRQKEHAFPLLFLNVWRSMTFAVSELASKRPFCPETAFQISCGVLSVCCARATDKIKSARIACHKALIDIGPSPRGKLESALSEELSRFVQHLERRKVHFSAAGCFDIGYGTILTVFGSVASYIVIVLQFD